MTSSNKAQQGTQREGRTPPSGQKPANRRNEDVRQVGQQDGNASPADQRGTSTREGERPIADVDRKVRGGDA